ncbi:hypothetical protein SBA3_20004 [Candidatus Sulfopaludibacter sp. SbA3]|nr:hypothetical protein SBA3_20004 [Candidatus Sulfopaludibacter sp. SbA3]
MQIHSFASQGFAYSNDNNYMTMKTSSGSFALTDLGANASMQISDNLRVGAQFYTRNVGNLGNWEPTLDWADGGLQIQRLVWRARREGKDHAGLVQRYAGPLRVVAAQ